MPAAPRRPTDATRADRRGPRRSKPRAAGARPSALGTKKERLRARERAVVAQQLEDCRRFHEWGDPFLGVWRAYALACDNNVVAPEWVGRYLRRVARALDTISREEQKRRHPAGRTFAAKILRALEITKRGPSVFERRRIGWRNAAMAEKSTTWW